MYVIRMEGKAKREFAELPVAVRQRFFAAFAMLEADPFRPRPGCDVKSLAGTPSIRPLRVGTDWGLHEVIGQAVLFVRFGDRRGVYR